MPTPDTKVITVLIADDHAVIREGLATIFKSQNDINIIAEAGNGREALERCGEYCPDILLLDLRMPEKDGLQVIDELAARQVCRPRVIVMTTSESDEDIRRAFKAGAKAYLVKGTAPQEIRRAVRRVAAGERLFPASIVSQLAKDG